LLVELLRVLACSTLAASGTNLQRARHVVFVDIPGASAAQASTLIMQATRLHARGLWDHQAAYGVIFGRVMQTGKAGQAGRQARESGRASLTARGGREGETKKRL
jgi:hypothetical protein